MKTTITIYSFRRGVGKSSLAVNLAALLAQQGRRVAVVDSDFQSPSIHLFFGFTDNDISLTLNDYLDERCDVLETVKDVTDKLKTPTNGKLFMISASTKIADIMQTLRDGLNVDRYTDGLEKLGEELNLDYVLIDSASGLNEDTLSAMAISNALVLLMRLNSQDYQGTAVTVDIARKLQVPTIHLVLNDTQESINTAEAHAKIEDAYHCGPGFIMPHSDELLALGSSSLFVINYPDHPLTERVKALAELL